VSIGFVVAFVVVLSLAVGAGVGLNQPEAAAQTTSCDPAYRNVCIPKSNRDLDCGDIKARNFDVGADDHHGFDGVDADNIGCEEIADGALTAEQAGGIAAVVVIVAFLATVAVRASRRDPESPDDARRKPPKPPAVAVQPTSVGKPSPQDLLVAELSALISGARYVAHSEITEWLERANTQSTKGHAAFKSAIATCFERAAWANASFIQSETDEWAPRLATRLGGMQLTGRQLEAAVQNEDAHQVLAGAGSGKTALIIARVAYLIESGLADPSGILILAFGRDAAQELRQRFDTLSIRGVEIRTFHAKGLAVLGEANLARPDVVGIGEQRRMFKLSIRSLFKNNEYRGRFVRFVKARLATPSQEVQSVPRDGEFETLRGDRVKSQGEVYIANWLYLNSIDYRYEAPYRVNTASTEYGQYHPDFHVVGTDIWIEYFGVNRQGRTAPGIDRAKYNEGTDWKQQLHRRHNSHLVECYFYDLTEGTLEVVLGEAMRRLGVAASPRTFTEDEARGLITNPELSHFESLMLSFISLTRSNQITQDELTRKASISELRARSSSFVEMCGVITKAYEGHLERAEKVDFDTMIKSATELLESAVVRPNYSHVLVDEAQDLSRGRAKFLTALRGTSAKLFAVGDDWQSIMRFTGVDLTYTLDFADHFGFTTRTALDRTFRFGPELAAATSKFVTQNKAQIVKQVEGAPTQHLDRPIRIYRVANENAAWTKVQERVDELAALCHDSGDAQAVNVAVLMRYNYECKALLNVLKVPQCLDVSVKTVHKSKGEEYDAVIVRMPSDSQPPFGRRGFPSVQQDDPLLQMVLAKPEPFAYAEERRLFYVALTRSRNGVDIVADKRLSPFVDELMSPGFQTWVQCEQENDVVCPSCGSPMDIRSRRSDGQQFYGCARYPRCSGTRNIDPADMPPDLADRAGGEPQPRPVRPARTDSAQATPVPQDLADRAGGEPQQSLRSARRDIAQPAPIVTAAPDPVFEKLRAWRLERSRKDGVPAFVIFPDTALRSIAEAMPKNETELLRIYGVGPAKLEKYSDDVLYILRSVVNSSDRPSSWH